MCMGLCVLYLLPYFLMILILSDLYVLIHTFCCSAVAIYIYIFKCFTHVRSGTEGSDGALEQHQALEHFINWKNFKYSQ